MLIKTGRSETRIRPSFCPRCGRASVLVFRRVTNRLWRSRTRPSGSLPPGAVGGSPCRPATRASGRAQRGARETHRGRPPGELDLVLSRRLQRFHRSCSHRSTINSRGGSNRVRHSETNTHRREAWPSFYRGRAINARARRRIAFTSGATASASSKGMPAGLFLTRGARGTE